MTSTADDMSSSLPTAARRPWRTRIRLRWLGLGALALAGSALFLLLRPEPAFPPLPIPNGYDDLVSAGKAIVGQAPELNRGPMSEEALQAFVEPNRSALERARMGLSRESRVPVGFSRDYVETHMNDVQHLRQLFRLMQAEGKLAAAQGRIQEALIDYLQLIQLGRDSARGGLMVDDQIGNVAEALGIQGLGALRSKLLPQDAEKLRKTLDDLDATKERASQVVARERLWYRRTAGVWERSIMRLSGMGERMMKPAAVALEGAHRLTTARTRLLITELALQSYRERVGRYPDRIEELVPSALTAVPNDPWSGRPLLYKKTGESYLLYSVGPDGQDDGGKSIPEKSMWAKDRGDVFLEPR